MHGMHYRAIDQQGQVHTGFSSGCSVNDIEQWIRQRGWQPLPLSRLQRLFTLLQVRPRSASWSNNSAALFTLNFAQLLAAGVPLLQALEEIANLERNSLVKNALLQVYVRVDQGDCLSDALSSCPELFRTDYIACVRAGEHSGRLHECLEQQAANLRWQADLANRLKSVFAYPVFACISIVLVMLFVLLYLVPAMQPLLSMSELTLPMHTRGLLALSSLLQSSWYWVALLLCGFVCGITSLYQIKSPIKKTLQAWMLRTRYGKIFLFISLARYARTISLLYEAGIKLTDAMRISQKMVNNRLLKNQLRHAHQLVLGGDSMGRAMQAQPDLPVLFVRMVVAGERAGVIGVAMHQCADQLHSNAQYALDRVERVIGPVLLCVMGAVLLWVAVSALGPLYASIAQTGSYL